MSPFRYTEFHINHLNLLFVYVKNFCGIIFLDGDKSLVSETSF
jgi:hypothetical protein